MTAVFNDCNITVSVAHAESPFVPYDKVIMAFDVLFSDESFQRCRLSFIYCFMQNAQQS